MKDYGSVLILLVTSKTSLSTSDTLAGTDPESPPLLVPPPLLVSPPPLLVPAVLIAEIAEVLVLMAVLIAVEMFLTLEAFALMAVLADVEMFFILEAFVLMLFMFVLIVAKFAAMSDDMAEIMAELIPLPLPTSTTSDAI